MSKIQKEWTPENEQEAIKIYFSLINFKIPKNYYASNEIETIILKSPLIQKEVKTVERTLESYLMKLDNIDYAFRRILDIKRIGKEKYSGLPGNYAKITELLNDYLKENPWLNNKELYSELWYLDKPEIKKEITRKVI